MTKTILGGAMMFLLVACGGDPTDGTDGAGDQARAGNETSSSSSAPAVEPAPAAAPAPAPQPAPGTDPVPSDPPKPAPADCTKRTNGALVTFSKGNETWSVWITNTKFNTEAFLAAAKGTYVTPVFTGLHDGVDCDGQFTWHVDAEDVAFEADYDVSCDALPSVVEADKATWLASKRWCPSKVLISAYQQQ